MLGVLALYSPLLQFLGFISLCSLCTQKTLGEKRVCSHSFIYLFSERLLNVRPVFAKISYVDNI